MNTHHEGNALVTPVPMHCKQSFQIAELCDSKITGHYSLHSFNPADSDSNVSLLDHTNIICTITYSQSGLASTILDKSCNLCSEKRLVITKVHAAGSSQLTPRNQKQ